MSEGTEVGVVLMPNEVRHTAALSLSLLRSVASLVTLRGRNTHARL